MAINDRIEKIKPYFLSFNILASEDASYVLTRFPNSWTIPDQTALKETYGIEIAANKDGIYFVTEIKNDAEKIFDCIEYVIEFNKNVEDRKALLSQKIKELSELFAVESLEKLKTLEFKFGKVTKVKTKKSIEDSKVENIEGTVKKDEVNNTNSIKEEIEDNGLMSLAKTIASE